MTEQASSGADQIAERSPAPQSSWLAERLAERLGGSAGVSTLYGAPVEANGVTIVPVVRLRWRIGGGGSRGAGGAEGAGGTLTAAPLGYIQMTDQGAEFKRIKQGSTALVIAPIILAGGVAVSLILRGVRQLVRG